MRQRLLLVPLLSFFLAPPLQAGGLFRKSDKPDPSVHVPILIQTLKAGDNERSRTGAAAALRDYDTKAFPDILPALTEALTSDPSSSVHSEAAESIGKIRPISAQAGYALEQAIANDKSLPVRLSARTALLQYRFLGFLSGKSELTMQTAEPPLATGPGRASPGTIVLRPTPSPMPVGAPVAPPKTGGPALLSGNGIVPKTSPQSGEPPLAPPKSLPPTELTSQPRDKTIPVVSIPSAPAPGVVAPIPPPVPTVPDLPKADPVVLPAPMPLPADVAKPPTKPMEEGPTLGPPPK